MKVPVGTISKKLIAEYAHQSVQIEGNRLAVGESVILDGHLSADVLQHLDLGKLTAQEISNLTLPDVSYLVPEAEPSQVTELRNHLVASRWTAESALTKPGTAGLDEDEVKYLAALTMKDVGRSGNYYDVNLGERVELGNYRKTPIGVRSNPLAIFPYPAEVPACMKRFFQWRAQVNEQRKLHPLIIACQTVVYIVHIHPFPDGNGRVSRMIMHDYMLRHGYLPVVVQGLDRRDYLKMIADAQDGNPDEFVGWVLNTQLECLTTFMTNESMN